MRFIERLAELLGERLVLAAGVRRFGKHAFRAAGAVFLSALGIDMYKLPLLARWASEQITHYARVAPLKSITEDFKRLHDNDVINPATIQDLEKNMKPIMNAALAKDTIKKQTNVQDNTTDT